MGKHALVVEGAGSMSNATSTAANATTTTTATTATTAATTLVNLTTTPGATEDDTNLVVWSVIVACIVGALLLAAVVLGLLCLRNKLPLKHRRQEAGSTDQYEHMRPLAHVDQMPWDRKE